MTAQIIPFPLARLNQPDKDDERPAVEGALTPAERARSLAAMEEASKYVRSLFENNRR